MLGKTFTSIFSRSSTFANRSYFSKLASHRKSENNSDSVPFDFTTENYKEIEKILAKYPGN